MRRPACVAASLTALGVLTSGCATSAFGPGTAPRAVPAGTQGARGEPSVPDEAGSAADAQLTAPVSASLLLLDESQAAREAGDLARAATVVERALAIDPNEAMLWIELAEIRLVQGDSDEARTLARKALTLAGADRSIAERAERLVAR